MMEKIKVNVNCCQSRNLDYTTGNHVDRYEGFAFPFVHSTVSMLVNSVEFTPKFLIACNCSECQTL